MLTRSIWTSLLLVLASEVEKSFSLESSKYELGHGDRVVALSVDQDGAYVASVSADRLLIVWNANNGGAIWARPNVQKAICLTAKSQVVVIERGFKELADRSFCVHCDLHTGREIARWALEFTDIDPVAFSTDGKWLAGASPGNSGQVQSPVYVWDVESGRLAYSHLGHWARTTAIGLGNDGRFVLLGCEDGMCVVLDNNDEFPPHYFSGHTKPIDSIASILGEDALVAASQDGVICWRESSNYLIAHEKPRGFQDGIVGVSPVSQMWAASTGDGTTDIFQGTSPSRRNVRLVDSIGFSCIGFSFDDAIIATGSYGGSIALWNARSGRKIRELGGKYGIPRSVVFAHGVSSVLAGYSANVAVMWDAMGAMPPQVLKGNVGDSSEALSVSCSSEGSVLATGHYLGDERGFLKTVQLWDARCLANIGVLRIPNLGANMGQVALSNDGMLLACGNGTWDVARRKRLWDFHSTRPGVVSCCRLTGDNDYVLLAGARIVSESETVGFLLRCDALTGETRAYRELAAQGFKSDRVRTFSLRPDGMEMIVQENEGWVAIDANTFEPKRVLELPSHLDIDQVTYFDGNRALIWCHSGTLVLYDLDTSTEVLALAGHTAPVTCVDVSPSEGRVVSGSKDKLIILWDVTSGKQLREFGAVER